MAVSKTSKRAGRTAKISISLDRSDVAWVKKRARRLYAGNVSAVAAEGLRRLREEEGRAALVEWLGDAATISPAERDTIHGEWGAPPTGIRVMQARQSGRRPTRGRRPA